MERSNAGARAAGLRQKFGELDAGRRSPAAPSSPAARGKSRRDRASGMAFLRQPPGFRLSGARLSQPRRESLSLAVADTPGCVAGSPASKAYFAATSDLDSRRTPFRGHAAAKNLNGGFLRAAKQWLHGNDAAMRVSCRAAGGNSRSQCFCATNRSHPLQSFFLHAGCGSPAREARVSDPA